MFSDGLCVMIYIALACLALCTESSLAESVITVKFDDVPFVNSEAYITVPPVNKLFITSDMFVINVQDQQTPGCEESASSSSNCTTSLNGIDRNITLDSRLKSARAMSQMFSRRTLNIHVDDTYEAACSTYVFPVILVAASTTNFTCNPVFVNDTLNSLAVTTVWKRSLLNSTLPVSNPVLFQSSAVTYSMDSSTVFIQLNNPEEEKESRGYYIPTFTLEDGTVINNTYPIVADVELRFRNPTPEFSVEKIYNPAVPVNFTYTCSVVSSFPPRVVWRFSSTNRSKSIFGVTDANVTLCDDSACEVPYFDNGGRLIIEDHEQDSSITVNGKLIIVNVTYQDAGIFTCFAENDVFRVNADAPRENSPAITVQLRVKDHLRPIWPTLGIVGVVLSVIVLMAIGTLCDKYFEGKKDSSNDNSYRERLFSVASGSGSPEAINNTQSHLSVKRLSSAKVQLLEEPPM